MRRIMFFAVASLLVCATLCGGTAFAQVEDEVVILGIDFEKPVVDAKYVADEVEIGVGGVKMFRIRASAVGYSPAERARIVDARLVHALSYGSLDPADVQVASVRGLPTVYVGNIRIVSVYPSDAEAAGGICSQKLAGVWASSLACCLRSLAPYARVAE